jgi:hypothetical protein
VAGSDQRVQVAPVDVPGQDPEARHEAARSTRMKRFASDSTCGTDGDTAR